MEARSAEYRRLVNQLAQDLVEVVERVGDLPARTSTELASVAVGHEDSALENDDADDEPGLVDLIAKVEEDLPAWTETIVAFSPLMQELPPGVAQRSRRLSVETAKVRALHIGCCYEGVGRRACRTSRAYGGTRGDLCRPA